PGVARVNFTDPWRPALAPPVRMRYQRGHRDREGDEDTMARYIKVAAAQMGPNNEGMSREEIVERMLALLDLAIQDQVELIAYPEMALTTYFPKKIRTDFDQFFE